MNARQRMHRCAAGPLLILCLLVPSAHGYYDAPWPPTISERYLALTSQLIVLAEPLDQPAGKLPTRYRVVEVIHQEVPRKGQGRKPLPPLKKGQEIKLALKQKYLLQPERKFVQYVDDRARLHDGKQTKPARIKQALLFLDAFVNQGEVGVRLVRGAAVRLLTADSKVLIPYNLEYPKNEITYHLLPLQGVAWGSLVMRVGHDVQQVARLRALRHIADAAKKNQAILDWIEVHAKEFCTYPWKWNNFEDTNRGWFNYEYEVGQWIYETGRVDDCWRLLELADREKNVFAASGGGRYAFHCLEGRRLLMKRLADAKLSESLRFRALSELSQSFWAGSDVRPKRDPTLEERKQIVAGLLPLLEHADLRCRFSALSCVETISLPPIVNRDRYPVVRDALDALAARYKQETHVPMRLQIIRALLPLANADYWRKLSGNPGRMGVIFKYHAPVGDELHFFMDLLTGGEPSVKLSGVPDLVCRRLEGDRVVETRVLQTRLANDQGNRNRFPTWVRYGRLSVSILKEKIPSGKWRIRARGKLSTGEAWQSEPLELTIQ